MVSLLIKTLIFTECLLFYMNVSIFYVPPYHCIYVFISLIICFIGLKMSFIKCDTIYRWHMRRIREQRHVERLRMRQRDPWYSGHSHYQPSVYTIWPQPQRDVRMIEITDTIPVMAFGEDLPDIPPALVYFNLLTFNTE